MNTASNPHRRLVEETITRRVYREDPDEDDADTGDLPGDDEDDEDDSPNL